MSLVVQGGGEQVAISEMLFRRCQQTSMVLVLQGGGGRMKEPGDAIANSEMLLRVSKHKGNKHDTCSAERRRER